jgi:DivIVA domain-containing protein
MSLLPNRGQVIMGIQELAGLALIVSGATATGRGLRALTRARRNEARSGAIKVGVWSDLLLGLGLFFSGVLYLGDPRYPQHITGLRWIPAGFTVAGLTLTVVPWIMSRSKARRLDASSAGTPGLSSASMPDPGPAIAPDAKTASLIERIKTVRFSTTRISPGYDEEEVDVFLDKLVAALGQDGQVDRPELREVQFSTTWMRPGYVIADVDAFLAEVAQATW